MSVSAAEIARLLAGTTQASAANLIQDLSTAQTANAGARTGTQILDVYRSKQFQDQLEEQREQVAIGDARAIQVTRDLEDKYKSFGDDANQRGLLRQNGLALDQGVLAKLAEDRTSALERAAGDVEATNEVQAYYDEAGRQVQLSMQAYTSETGVQVQPLSAQQLEQINDKGFIRETLQNLGSRVASGIPAAGSLAAGLGGLAADGIGRLAGAAGDALGLDGDVARSAGDAVQGAATSTAQLLADTSRNVGEATRYNDLDSVAQQLESQQTRERFSASDKGIADYAELIGTTLRDSADADFASKVISDLGGDLITGGVVRGGARALRSAATRGAATPAAAPGALRRNGLDILLAGQAQEFAATPGAQTGQEALARVGAAGAEALTGGVVGRFGGTTLEGALSGAVRGGLGSGGVLNRGVQAGRSVIGGAFGESAQEFVGSGAGQAATQIGQAAQANPDLGFREAFDTVSTPEARQEQLTSAVQGGAAGLVAGGALRGPAAAVGSFTAPRPAGFDTADRNPNSLSAETVPSDGLSAEAAQAATTLDTAPLDTTTQITGNEQAPLRRASEESQYGGADVTARATAVDPVLRSLLREPGTTPDVAQAQLAADAVAFGFEGQFAIDYARQVTAETVAARTISPETRQVIPPSANTYLDIVKRNREQIEDQINSTIPPADAATTLEQDVDAIAPAVSPNAAAAPLEGPRQIDTVPTTGTTVVPPPIAADPIQTEDVTRINQAGEIVENARAPADPLAGATSVDFASTNRIPEPQNAQQLALYGQLETDLASRDDVVREAAQGTLQRLQALNPEALPDNRRTNAGAAPPLRAAQIDVPAETNQIAGRELPAPAPVTPDAPVTDGNTPGRPDVLPLQNDADTARQSFTEGVAAAGQNVDEPTTGGPAVSELIRQGVRPAQEPDVQEPASQVVNRLNQSVQQAQQSRQEAGQDAEITTALRATAIRDIDEAQAQAEARPAGRERQELLQSIAIQRTALDRTDTQIQSNANQERATAVAQTQQQLAELPAVAEAALTNSTQIAPAQDSFTQVLNQITEQRAALPSVIRTEQDALFDQQVKDLVDTASKTVGANPILASFRPQVDALITAAPRPRRRPGLEPNNEVLLGIADTHVEALDGFNTPFATGLANKLRAAAAPAGSNLKKPVTKTENTRMTKALSEAIRKADAHIKKKGNDARANRITRRDAVAQEPDARDYTSRATVGTRRGVVQQSLDQSPRPGTARSAPPRPFNPDTRTVARAVTDLIGAWPSKPGVTVVQSYADFPAAVRRSLEEQGLGPDADVATRAATFGNKVYIAAEDFTSVADVQAVVLEEVLGHQGLKKLYGPKIDTELNNIYKQVGELDGLLRMANRFGLDLVADYRPLVESVRRNDARAADSKRALVEELIGQGLARQQLEPRVQSLVSKVLGRIRQWIKNRVPAFRRALDTHMTDEDILQIMREAARAGRELPEAAYPSGQARANRALRGRAFPVATGRVNGRTQWSSANAAESEFESANITDGVRATYGELRDTATTLLTGGRPEGGNRRQKFLESKLWVALQKKLQNSRVEARVTQRKINNAIARGAYNIVEVANELFAPTLDTDKGGKVHPGLINDSRFAGILDAARRPANADEGAGTIDGYKLTEIMDVDQNLTTYTAVAQDRLRRDGDPIQKRLVDKVDALAAYLDGISQADAERSADSYFKARHAPERNNTMWVVQGAKLSKEDNAQRKELLKQLAAPVPTGVDPDVYLQGVFIQLTALSRRATNLDARAAYSASGLTDAAALEIVTKAENAPGKSPLQLRNMYDGIYAELSAMHKLTDQYQTEAGSYSRIYDQSRRAYNWKNYVPLKGGQINSDQFKSVPGMLRQVDSLQETVHLTRGRTSEADSSIGNTLADMSNAASHMADQAVNRAIILQVAATGSSSQHARATGNFWKGRVRRLDINSKAFQKLNREAPRDRVVYFDPQNETSPQGEQYAWVAEIKSEAAQDAAKGSRATELEKGMQKYGLTTALSMTTRMMTRYNVNFIPVNVIRDAIFSGAVLGAEVDAEAAGNFTRNLLATRKASQVAKYVYHYNRGEFDAIDNLVATDNEGIAGELDRFFRVGGRVSFIQQFGTGNEVETRFGGNTAQRAGRKVNEAFDLMNDTGETLTRFAVFRTLIDKGWSDQRAAAYAKNIANFEQVGQYGGILGSLYGFFRASATGAVRTVESVVQGENGPVVAAAFFGAGVLAYGLAVALSPEDEEGNNLIATSDKSQWTRAFQFALPNGTLVSLPVGFGYGGAGAIGAQTAALLAGHQSFAGLVDNTTKVVTDNVSPLQPSGISLSETPVLAVGDTLTPTLLKPWLQFVANTNAWGVPIMDNYSDNYEGINDALLSRGGTYDTFYKTISDNLFEKGIANVAPETIRHFTSSYALGMAQVTETMFEWYKIGSGQDSDYVSDKKRAALGFRAFINKPLSTVPTDYYNRRDMIQSLKKQRKELEGQGFDDLAASWDATHPGLARAEEQLKAATTVVDAERERMKELRQNGTERGVYQQAREDSDLKVRRAQSLFLNQLDEQYR